MENNTNIELNSSDKNLNKKVKFRTSEQKKEVKMALKLNKPKRKPKDFVCDLKDNEIIKLKNVEKYLTNGYNCEHVLKGIDLTIYKGEFVVIVGPSGSGKTTLLTLISALDRPSKGECLLFDKNTAFLNASKLTKLRAQHVGYIFQQYGLLDDLTVKDNIKIAMNLKKDNNIEYQKGSNPFLNFKNKIKYQNEKIDNLLKMVGLYEHKNKKAIQLSGGQSQRVAICRALVKDPDILFGDEPTGAIHISSAIEIMRLFTKINQDKKTTIIIVTHNDAIKELADRVIRIESGKIKENFINKNKKTVDQINWSQG